MKKILTLALALVLVFAIAAPALAITGDVTPPTATPVGIAPVQLDVALLKADPSYQYSAVLSFDEIASNKAYIVNEIVFWGVGLNFVKPVEGQKLGMPEADYKGAVLTLSCDAFDFDSAFEAYVYDATAKKFVADGSEKLALNATKNLLTYTVNDALWSQDNDLYFFGQGVVAAKGVLKASLTKAQSLDTAGEFVELAVAGVPTYRVSNAGWGYQVDILAGANKGNAIKFEVDTLAKGNVIAIYVNADKVTYTVPVSNEGAVLESIGDLEDEAFADAKAAYLEVMNFFGFNYNAKGSLFEKHFLAKSSVLNLRDEATVQLYTADIVVPGGVTPPKTGDAASIVGFVMIAVAMIAAGVVVSRKVRA